MSINVAKEVAALGRMTTSELRQRYADVFGEPTRANNKPWLVKRIAWRLQAQAEGGLSDRARRRAEELARDEDLRVVAPRPPKSEPVPVGRPRLLAVTGRPDRRLPVVGSVLTRDYKGRTVRVTVLERGFAFEGEVFKSLSAVAKHITGTHCNGFWFFNLTGGRDE